MEKIKFIYEFSDPENKEMTDVKKIVTYRESESGLFDPDVCEMFMDFMKSVGYSEDNIFSYFN